MRCKKSVVLEELFSIAKNVKSVYVSVVKITVSKSFIVPRILLFSILKYFYFFWLSNIIFVCIYNYNYYLSIIIIYLSCYNYYVYYSFSTVMTDLSKWVMFSYKFYLIKSLLYIKNSYLKKCQKIFLFELYNILYS